MGSEFSPTGLIQALMETLVDPSLPSRVENEPPRLSVQQSVARQMHAVVLLYNYYHRKQQPKSEFIHFVAFCKLTMDLREAMMPFMKITIGNEAVKLKDINDDNKLSVTEKAIRDACDISMALIASRDVLDMKGWPISKVAVFLVDSKNESCLLQLGGVTEGIWSLIEKQLDEYSIISQISSNKRKRDSRASTSKNNADVDGFLQLAFKAVKEATGLSSTDLVILGCHTVYSLNKEETAARFYMMQCSRISKDKGTPIEEMFKSLQGPLFENIDGEWEITTAVDYFHLQPYADIISLWLSTLPDLDNIDKVQSQAIDNSRESRSKLANDKKYKQKEAIHSKISQAIDKSRESCSKLANDRKYKHSSMQKEATPVKISETIDNSRESRSKLANDRKYKHSSTQTETGVVRISQATDCSRESRSKLANDRKHRHSLTQEDASAVKISRETGKADIGTGKSKEVHVDHIDDVLNQNVGKEWPKGSPSGRPTEPQMTFETCLSDEDATENQISKAEKSGACAPVGEDDVETEDSLKSKDTHETNDKVTQENCNATTSCSRGEVPSANAELIEELQNDPAIEALENTLAILSKREQEMYSEICSREVQFALLQRNIQKVSDALECMKSMSAPYGVSSKSDNQQRSSIKLIDSPKNSSCQDLESMCLKNNWRLPRYLLEPSDGKFIAKVVVTEKDKFFFATSDLKTNPDEARESAAAQLVTQLQNSLYAND